MILCCVVVLVGVTLFQRSPKAPSAVAYWQDCSSSKLCIYWRSRISDMTSYFQDGGHNVRRPLAATCSSVRRLFASPPSAFESLAGCMRCSFLINNILRHRLLINSRWQWPVAACIVSIGTGVDSRHVLQFSVTERRVLQPDLIPISLPPVMKWPRVAGRLLWLICVDLHSLDHHTEQPRCCCCCQKTYYVRLCSYKAGTDYNHSHNVRRVYAFLLSLNAYGTVYCYFVYFRSDSDRMIVYASYSCYLSFLGELPSSVMLQ